jgi:RNA polymerase sigma-70 factor (ECF subfamily)
MNSSADRSIAMSGKRTEAERRRFESLCAPLKADVFRFLYWLCRDRSLAEDVMQETLLRAWKSIDSLSDEKAVRPWLLTIARRELARTYERKRIPTVDLDSTSDSEREAFAVSDDHDVQEMRRAILQLDVIHREPLILQVMLGYSTEEIARQLQISLPAVLTRLHRARHVLRKHMLGDAAERGACE